jgi:hypothetical protein
MIDQGAGAIEFSERGAPLSRLPKSVRMLGKWPAAPDGAPEFGAPMYEFEVLTGNAAYRAGERFYLTADQAQRAYRINLA